MLQRARDSASEPRRYFSQREFFGKSSRARKSSFFSAHNTGVSRVRVKKKKEDEGKEETVASTEVKFFGDDFS